MYRIGQSRDIHQLQIGRKLILGTIEIPSEKGLVGHSDADCLVHAICEAVIGALALGDMGKLFPDTVDLYKNISSSYFLKEIKKLLIENKYCICNIDSTIIIEKPMMRPFIDDMRKSIALLLDIDVSKINIKATRGEKLGYIGEEKGCEAEAIVLLHKQDN